MLKKTIDVHFKLTFEYEHMDKVMRIIKEKNLVIVNQKMEMNCVFEVSVRKKFVEATKMAFENLRCLTIK